MAAEVAQTPMELDEKNETVPAVADSSEEEEPAVAKASENGEEVKNGHVDMSSSADEFEKEKKNGDVGSDEHEDEEPKEAEIPVTKSKPKSKAKPKAEPTVKKPREKKTAAIRKDFDSSLVGALDASLAEQVKHDGLRRERKQVQHFVPDSTPKEVKAIVIAEGRGIKISEIPYAADQIQKHKANELHSLHKILYDRRGTLPEVKKNIRLFSGFAFEEGSTAYTKKKAQLQKVEMGALKQVCDVIGLMKKGTKEQVVERVLEFCMKPDDSGVKPLATKSKTKSSKKSSSRSSSKRSSSSKAGKSTKGKKRKLDSDEEEDDVSDQDKSEDEEEYSPRKRARDGPTRTASTGKSYQEVDDVEEEDDDEEPEVKPKGKSPSKSKAAAKPKAAAKATPPAEKPKIVYKDDLESDSPIDEDDDSDDGKKKKKRSSKGKKAASKKKPASPSKKEKKSSGKKSSAAKKDKKSKAKDLSDSEAEAEAEETNGKQEKEKPAKKTAGAKKFSAPPAKKAKVDSDKEVEKDNSGGSSDDEWDDDLPSKDELKETVVRIVKDSDLRKVTMKMIIEKVFKEYPDVDLEKKRNFIKGIVKEVM